MEPLRIAIIGQGRSGRDIHAAYLKTDPRYFRIVAVAEALPERRERAAAELGCRVYESYQPLLDCDDVDLVVNASFSHQHVPITLDLMRHGKNVLVEKPCARTEADVRLMMQTAEEHGVVFAVFHQSRFAPYFHKVREVLASGVLGKIFQISIAFNGFARRWDWQTLQACNAGSLYNTGPHPLDQALQLLDYDGMPQVFCRMERANTFGDAEDYVKLILTAPDRPLIDLEVSSCDAYPLFTYKIQGSCGGLQGGYNELEWRYFDPQEAPEQTLCRAPLCNAEGLPAYCSEQLRWITEHWQRADDGIFSSAVRQYYHELYHWIVDGAPMQVTPAQVAQQIAVIDECHRQNPMQQIYF